MGQGLCDQSKGMDRRMDSVHRQPRSANNQQAGRPFRCSGAHASPSFVQTGHEWLRGLRAELGKEGPIKEPLPGWAPGYWPLRLPLSLLFLRDPEVIF